MIYESDTLITPGRGKSLIRQFLERKQMSTKTTFKRVALVAAAALTLGGISGVAAHAVAPVTTTPIAAPYIDVFAPSTTAGALDSATAASSSTTGWSVTQTASAAPGYTKLVAANDVISTVVATTPFAATSNYSGSLASLTTNFQGASGISASPASVVIKVTNPGIFGFLGNSQLVTVSGTSLTVSGTTVNAGVDSNGNTELKESDLTSGFSAGVLSVASNGALPNTVSPVLASALAPYINGGLFNLGATTFTVVSGSDASITINTPTAATISAATVAQNLGGGVSTPGGLIETFNVTVLAGAAATTFSSVRVSATNVTAPYTPLSLTNPTSFVAPASVASDLQITATIYDSTGNPISNPLLAPALTYSVAGVGLLSTTPAVGGTGAVGQTYIAVPAIVSAPSNSAYLLSDGRSGTSTVTVSANGTAVGVFTVTFYGKVASVTAVPLLSIGQAGGNTAGKLVTTEALYAGAFGSAIAGNNPAIAVVLKDANGTVIPSAANLTVVSSNPSVILSSIPTWFVDNGLGADSVAFGYIHTTYASAYGSTSGQKATLTYSVQNSDGSIVSSAPVALSLGGSVAKETISLDAASYTAGAPMTLTATAVDSSGNPVYDGAAGAALTANKNVVGLPTITYSGGKYSNKANTLFAPATPGDFTIYGAGADAASTAYTITATVGNDAADAASLATDAANAATDAANAAAESADNATQAASDALAAVQSLQSYVSKLFSGVKKEIAALLKLVHALKK